MIKYHLKFKNYVKIKNFLPVLSNFYLFTINFDYVLNLPQYTLVFLSLKQKEVYNIKKFLFCKLNNLVRTIFLYKKFLFYKKTFQFFFVTDFYCFLIFTIFFQILNFIFKKIFSFIPNCFRLQQNNKNFLNEKYCKTHFSPYILRLDINCKISNLFKSSLKFLKKFVSDQYFINFFLQLFLISMRKNKFADILNFNALFTFFYFSQLDCFICFFFINKINITLKKKIQGCYYKIGLLISRLLATLKQNFFSFRILKKTNFLKNKTDNFKFQYKRVNNTFLVIFFGFFSTFLIFKKQLSVFLQLIFSDIKVLTKTYFTFLGFNFKFNNYLEKIKHFTNARKKILKKYFVIKTIPLQALQKSFLQFGLLNKFNKPLCYNLLINYFSKNVFYWYLNFFFGFVNYYKSCLNFYKFMLSFYYICKWSLLFTLAKKHKKTVNNVIKNYFNYFNKLFLKNAFKPYIKYKLYYTQSFNILSYVYKYTI